MDADNYNNKNSDLRRSSRDNHTRGTYRYSSINYSKDDKQEAMVNTILGTLNLISKRDEGKLNISDEDINEGIKINAEHLGISEEEYREKMSMITDPKPEENPESDSETSTETNEPRT